MALNFVAFLFLSHVCPSVGVGERGSGRVGGLSNGRQGVLGHIPAACWCVSPCVRLVRGNQTPCRHWNMEVLCSKGTVLKVHLAVLALWFHAPSNPGSLWCPVRVTSVCKTDYAGLICTRLSELSDHIWRHIGTRWPGQERQGLLQFW